tara:strand:- start:871 stop:1728 length:858 start_codon:yes stop_codon:yes gene_type:complete
MKILIIGADSLIGKSLSIYLKSDDIIKTTRQKNREHTLELLYFDLEKSEAQWPNFPDDIDCAFIAASITNQKKCENDPKLAMHVNVTQTIKLIKRLISKNIHVVFPSTNIVLGCKIPMQHIDEPLSPIGAYALGKAEVEKKFKNNPKVTIARLPKVLDCNSGILQKWSDDLIKGNTIEAYNNLKISPVSLDYICHFIKELIYQKPTGIWHISGEREISYCDVAYLLCDKLNIDRKYVIESAMPHSQKAASPVHPSLDCSSTKIHLGIPPQSLSALLEDTINKIRV